MKIFRYVSWASNGVSDILLKPLYAEIDGDLDKLTSRIAALGQRPDLSSVERTAMQGLLAKWQVCKNQAKDTIDVGQTDAAMATMMIGQTDDAFKAVDTDVQDLSAAISYNANDVSTALYSAAERNKKISLSYNACWHSDQYFCRLCRRPIDREAHKVHYQCDATPFSRGNQCRYRPSRPS